MRERLVTWALIVALALGGFVLYRWAGAEHKRANDAEQDLKTLRIKHRAILLDVQALEQKRETSRKDLKDALEKNKDWADGPVPTAVVDSLCKRLRCN
jgi:Flp pilus assembly protein TadB